MSGLKKLEGYHGQKKTVFCWGGYLWLSTLICASLWTQTGKLHSGHRRSESDKYFSVCSSQRKCFRHSKNRRQNQGGLDRPALHCSLHGIYFMEPFGIWTALSDHSHIYAASHSSQYDIHITLESYHGFSHHIHKKLSGHHTNLRNTPDLKSIRTGKPYSSVCRKEKGRKDCKEQQKLFLFIWAAFKNGSWDIPKVAKDCLRVVYSEAVFSNAWYYYHNLL